MGLVGALADRTNRWVSGMAAPEEGDLCATYDLPPAGPPRFVPQKSTAAKRENGTIECLAAP